MKKTVIECFRIIRYSYSEKEIEDARRRLTSVIETWLKNNPEEWEEFNPEIDSLKLDCIDYDNSLAFMELTRDGITIIRTINVEDIE